MGKVSVSVSVITLNLCEGADMSRLPASAALAAKWRVIPLKIRENNGGTLSIDRVTDISRRASTKAGVMGLRYVCLVTVGEIQREICLYKDDNDWFMETGDV